MKTLAKIIFDCPSERNLEDDLMDVIFENNWNDFGSIKIEFLDQAKKIAKEISIKNNVKAIVSIHGTLNNGRFDRKNVIEEYEL